jgi:hypothetical protein
MRPREFVELLGGAAATAVWPGISRAQSPSAKVFRVGFLGLPSADSLPKRTEAFRAGLRDLGYQEGRDVIIEYRWANSAGDAVKAGGLMAYGPNIADNFHRAAELVDKILRGAKPADIPVEQPTKFDLIINLKTAKALDLTMPASLLARADEVIE